MSPLNNMRVVGGTAKGHRLRGAVIPGVRPTSERARAAIFNVLPPQILEDARVLDLFAGTGSLGIEALSQGAAWADFVERNRRQFQALQSNLDNTGFRDRSRAYCGDAARLLETLPGPYRLVLLDPPYKMADLGQFMKRLGATGKLVEDAGVVVVGHSRHVTLEPQYGNLGLTSGRRYGDNLVDFYQRGGN
ncbi:MAG: 16S rRNA (guanine(966)-N(2))-methyltransferase RsmD [Chloroflexota bacterium]|nr:16S rRNA (guanine(966)-N(2))-methyltransferase RsmD [Chloroflexota bacterium]